ncbi:MAG: 50S ribosomal protein L4 [Chloroflexia bacterium]|nr:50S ribosomal protein L4 [Chloroflexia bacterium]
MRCDVHNIAGEITGQIDLDESVWGIEPHISVMHQALLRQLANARKGTHNTLTRGQVRGGGRKPWRQKGTGRARQGSIRSPQWKGGGVVWGPHPRSYVQAMPRKMRRLAIRSALSAKLRDERLTVVEGLMEIEPRTKIMKSILEKLPLGRSTLIVVPERVDVIIKAAGNLPEIETIQASVLNVRDLLKYDRLMVTREAIAVIEGLWALPEAKRAPSKWKLARMAARGQDIPEIAVAADEGITHA